MFQGYLPVAHFVISADVMNYATFILRNSAASVNLLVLRDLIATLAYRFGELIEEAISRRGFTHRSAHFRPRYLFSLKI
jgi:hypothetical protein